LHGASALLLIWANPTYNYIGLAIFILLVIYQIIRKKKHPGQQQQPIRLSSA
jgi:tellurite resistance protein TehA-like permease